MCFTVLPAQAGVRTDTNGYERVLICADINANCDVEGLCRKLPARAQAVFDAEGDRIKP